MNRLVVNGCSYMNAYAQGGGHEDLASRLKIDTAVDQTQSGCANNRIIRTTIKDSHYNESTLYVLGMTFVGRSEATILKVQNEENIYYSIENNGIGKASLMAYEELGPVNFYGNLVNEPKTKGQMFTRGMVTTHKNKLEACSKLKYFVEEKKVKIYSRNLIQELKTFVARGRSYAAKDGAHDDLVMAAVLCIRIVQLITKHDKEAFEELIDPLGDDPLDMPMPIGIL